MKYLYKKLFKKIIFLFDPEIAHKISLKLLNIINNIGLAKFLFLSNTSSNIDNNNSKKLCVLLKPELKFKNRVGIAAGLDKNGEYIHALASTGAGFIEVGTVTPRPQLGNKKPRLFRLKKHEAIINRMGFNNLGIDNLIKNIIKYRDDIKVKVNKQSMSGNYSNQANDSIDCSVNNKVIIGINIGKNADTPIEKAVDDYLICFRKAYDYADYICINISSPNTQNLRELQKTDNLKDLLSAIYQERELLKDKFQKYQPVALKIAPDLTIEQIDIICELCIKYKIDIIIATNTTNEHELLYDTSNNDRKKIQGGLSGKPLFDKSNKILEQIIAKTKNSNNDIVVIGVGGISSPDNAIHKLSLGADLVQIYSGMIYQGPGLICETINKIKQL